MAVELVRVSPMLDVDPAAIAPPLEATSLARRAVTGIAVSYSEDFLVHTTGTAPAFFDITDLVTSVVRRTGIQDGQALTTTAHTTCALIIQENEPLLLADLAERLERLVSQDDLYRHNMMDCRVVNMAEPEERANGHSHLQHALLGLSVALPVRDFRLALGRWQRILLVELDHPRPRELCIQIVGVAPLLPDAAGHAVTAVPATAPVASGTPHSRPTTQPQ